jgi:hypothetical protein
MKVFKFIIGWMFISFLLLFSVVIVDKTKWLMQCLVKGDCSAFAVYSLKDQILGVLSEGLRALLLCYLFPQIKDAGRSYLSAIKYGLIISALIATMWLIIGYGSFVLKDPDSFFMYDAIILMIQGILSGAGLRILMKKHFI